MGLKNSRIWKYCKRIGTVVHFLVSPTQGLCLKPRPQSREHHVPLGWCGSCGSSPTLGNTTRGCSTLRFCWCWLVKSRGTNHGNSHISLCIVAAILIGWWQMRPWSKVHDPRHQLGWSAADRAANNVANVAVSLAPSNLRRDPKAPGRAK